MNFVGFTGPGDQELSRTSALDLTRNYYCEWSQVAGVQKSGPKLYPRPAAASFGVNPPQVSGMARGKISYNGLAYGVNGTDFCAIGSNGGLVSFGKVVNDGKPCRLVANSSDTNAGNGQIAIASGGELYIYSGGVLTHIVNDGVNFFGAADVDFMDGYFIVVIPNSSKFQISALNDGLKWSGADVAALLGQADHIRAIQVTKEYFYLLGDFRTEVWYNNGNAFFPFTIEPGAFIEEGTEAVASRCKSEKSAFWLAQRDSGGAYAVRTEGLSTRPITPQWVSTRWQNKDPQRGTVYPTLSDCITFVWTWNGHVLVRFIFPTANESWDYDVTESDRVGFNVWTVNSFTDGNGLQNACVERDHCYCYGLHIVGSGGADGSPGRILQYSQTQYYDCDDPSSSPAFLGFPITRDRICRLPYNDGKWASIDKLELFFEPGTGLSAGDATPIQGEDPVCTLRISRDGGATWGEEYFIKIGKQGQYQWRAMAQQLGKYRDGAVWVRITDPVFACLIGAEHYLRGF